LKRRPLQYWNVKFPGKMQKLNGSKMEKKSTKQRSMISFLMAGSENSLSMAAHWMMQKLIPVMLRTLRRHVFSM